MTLPRSTQQARAARKEESGRAAPWVPWAVGIGLLLAGALASYISLYLLARPVMDHIPAVKSGGQVSGLPAGAEVVGPEPTAVAAPGEQVELTWEVRNAGQTDWPDDLYWFAPAEGQATPVITVPKNVAPGQQVTVRTRLILPAAAGTWRPAWNLTGPGGKVAGGHLTAQISVVAGTEP